jgi:hypothetical protein
MMTELLVWVAFRPRTYDEAMEAWRTSCPRMPVWDEALLGGLVEVAGDASTGLHGAPVRLTAKGEAFLASCAR